MKNQYLRVNLWSGGRKMWWYGRTARDGELFAPDSAKLKSSHRLKSVRWTLTPLSPDGDNHHRRDCSSQLHPSNKLPHLNLNRSAVLSGPGTISNQMLCAFTVHTSALCFSLFFRAIILRICVATEAMFHYASICEILCWITVTSGRCAAF